MIQTAGGATVLSLRPLTQAAALFGATALVAWSLLASAAVIVDLAGNRTGGAATGGDAALYETRLTDLAAERDSHAAAAREAQAQFGAALDDLSRLQEDLFQTKLALREQGSGREALRALLGRAMADRDALEARIAALGADAQRDAAGELSAALAEAEAGVDFLTEALTRTALDRDALRAIADAAELRAADLERTLAISRDANDRIFSQLEEAVALSMAPLDRMFRAAGLPPERIIDQMRARYSGQGGPLTPISFSTKGVTDFDADSLRANDILVRLDELNLYRLAVDKLPFALPVAGNVRKTSGFGYRSDPIRGGRRLHAGLDWAGSTGSPISATADGVVVHAGWLSGYGRIVKIRHEFGVETRYAHLARIDVKVGQKVSRGQKIGGMGNSGRSTGTHLHYEVRVDGRPVNPMTYIRAARDVL